MEDIGEAIRHAALAGKLRAVRGSKGQKLWALEALADHHSALAKARLDGMERETSGAQPVSRRARYAAR